MAERPYIITFAGPIGVSKTPISHYLSIHLGLPIYNNDAVRSEIIQDLGTFDQHAFEQRRNQRLQLVLSQQRPVIIDASIDRRWADSAPQLANAGFDACIISIDIERPFLQKLYQDKGFTEGIPQIDRLLTEHQQFLARYGDQVAVHITEENFPQRLAVALTGVQQWLEQRSLKNSST